MDQDLLMKYITGEVTQPEREEVGTWLDASPENFQEFLQLRRAYDALVWQDRQEERISTRNKIFRTRPYIWLQAAAAVLLLIIGFTASFLFSESEGQWQTVYVPEGNRTQIMLADSTVVWVGSNSKLTFPNQFSSSLRQVKLEGEAYFEVTKDPRKQFVVTTPYHTAIHVHGTKFNVKARLDAESIVTTLLEGAVSFESNKNGSLMTRLEPGQKLVYHIKSGDIDVTRTTGDRELMWKDDKVVFENASLQEVLAILSDQYDVEFVQSRGIPTGDVFTGTFVHQNVEQILRFIKLSSNIGWRELPAASGKRRIEIYYSENQER